MLLNAITAALACDLALFSIIPPPAGAELDTKVFATGSTRFRDADLVGGRVMTVSRYTLDEWKVVLFDTGNQEDWQPARLGNARTELIDGSHLYMQLDVPIGFGAFHIRRQIVANFANFPRGDSFRSCWQVIDPTPWLAQTANWQNGTDWENDTYGCWDLTSRADGTTLVSYQWWSDLSSYPSIVRNWMLSHTLPDMVDAFQAQVARLAGR